MKLYGGWDTVWKRIAERFGSSLTARIFLITALILAAACAATYGFLVWATPISYVSVVTDDLKTQTLQLLNLLQDTTYEDSAPLFERFILQTGAMMSVYDESGAPMELPVSIAVESTCGFEEAWDSAAVSVTGTEADFQAADDLRSDVAFAIADEAGGSGLSGVGEEFVDNPFSFAGDPQVYLLEVRPSVTAVNQATRALNQVLPLVALVVLTVSLLGAVFYSRYITRPIVRISAISKQMAELDFSQSCRVSRSDEIGVLAGNLNTLSARLNAALDELQSANAALQRDIDRERELERQRAAFFAAASHELKTPITVLKGQLSGMLAGIDVYRDRDKYLARSLAVAGRMERLVAEILTVSRMERAEFSLRSSPVDLSALLRDQTELLRELAEQKRQTLTVCLAPKLHIRGDAALLERAAANLLSNASLHSPEGAALCVSLAAAGTSALLTIRNSGVRIPEECLPHLFEAFYRADASRSRETGGSGLGLYLTRMILERHGAVCRIENTPDGVLAAAEFPCLPPD